MGTKCIKLISGEEIITDVTNETPTAISFKNPVCLMVVGEGQMALVPWLPLAEKSDFIISADRVMLTYVPKTDLVNAYKQKTGGIVTAGAGALNQLPPTPPNFGR